MTIFGFPFAGGDAYCYRKLREHLPPAISLQTLELPGRGRRSGEPFITSVASMADEAVTWLGRPRGPFVLFGHSMGAAIGIEVARRLFSSDGVKPVHLIVSGRAAPQFPSRRRRSGLPPLEFRNALRELGACPEEVLRNEELMNYIEPVLRADFQAIERYQTPVCSPLDIGISVLVGDDDDVTPEEAQAWQTETKRPIRIARFTGGHFFLFDHAAAVAGLMAEACIL